MMSRKAEFMQNLPLERANPKTRPTGIAVNINGSNSTSFFSLHTFC
jgi:hypothetical protein